MAGSVLLSALDCSYRLIAPHPFKASVAVPPSGDLILVWPTLLRETTVIRVTNPCLLLSQGGQLTASKSVLASMAA
jgi:hypothetical protein